MTENKLKKHMSNIVFEFFMLKFFNIQTREVELVFYATRDYPYLASCVDIFKGSRDEYACRFSTFFRRVNFYLC